MLDILRDYITETATPELVAALVSAHEIFEHVQLENYEQGFEELLMTNEEVDSGETLLLITNLTQGLLRQLLANHGVTLVDDLRVSQLTLFLGGLLDLSEYDNPHDVLGITSLDESPEEVLAQLLTLVTDKMADELLVEIEEVNAGLITKVKEFFSTKDETIVTEEEQKANQRYIDQFKKLCSYLQETPHDVGEMLSHGMIVGLPFATYAGSIGRDLETYPDQKVAQELLAMALISGDGIDNPRAVINAHIDKFISNVDKITRIDIGIGKILLGLNQNG